LKTIGIYEVGSDQLTEFLPRCLSITRTNGGQL
jgi:hypothetical protein